MPHRYRIEDISYQITEHCPGPCRYCSIWESKERREDELTSAELDNIFSSKYLDLKKVHITGGEPHLTDTYFRAIDSITKYHKQMVIDSPITGWYPDRHVEIANYARSKMDLIRLDISLDGDEDVNNKIRLHKDAFAKSIETIHRLQKIKGVALRLQFTIYKENLHLIEWVYNYAKKLGVGLYLGYGRYNPDRYKNVKDNLTKEPLSKEDFFFSKEDMAEIDRQLIAIGYDKSRYAFKYSFQKALYEGKKVEMNCYMGMRNIDIDPYGDIYPCLMWVQYLKMGNIRTDGGFDKILEGRGLEVLDRVQNKECQKDCLFTCATKCEILEPNIKSAGIIPYSGGTYGFAFSDNDLIPLRPWWYDEYKERGLI